MAVNIWKSNLVTYSSFRTGLSIVANVSTIRGLARTMALPFMSIDVSINECSVPGEQLLMV